MKKAFIYIILVYYVILSALKVVELHYCQGSLRSIAFITETQKCCHEHNTKELSCCIEITIKIDIGDEQLSSNPLLLHIHAPLELITNKQPHVFSNIKEPIPTSFFSNEGAPPLEKYKVYHSFLFYN